MKKFSLLIMSVALLGIAACSKKEVATTSAPPQSTPDAQRLKSDSERLQQATANAAKQREKESQTTAALSPTPTATP